MTPEQFLLFAESLPEPMLLLAGDGLIFAGNRAVEKRLGISVAGLQGKRLAEVVVDSPDEVSRYLRLCSRSRSLVLGAMRLQIKGSEGIACRLEGTLISPKKAGAAAVLMLRLMPKESAAGQFVALNQRIEELGSEIQRRKLAEAEARQKKEWLQVTLHSIGDGVICTDSHGCVTMMNSVAEFLTGWTQDAAQGQPLEVVFPIINEQSRKPVENPVGKVLQHGGIVGLANHTILVARDGTERPIDDSAAPINDESGKILGVVLIFRDVTEQRRAEQEFRTSEARKSAILDTALDCIITMDQNGNIVDFNPAAEKTFGWLREQVVGRDLADFIIPPSLRERHRKGMKHYFATGEGPVLGKRLELTALRSDGTEFPVELAITRIPANGPPLFTAYLRDISERQRVEQNRSVRLAATHALSVAEGSADGTSGILQAVCENLGWEVGFFWSIKQSQTTLVCTTGWHRSDLTVADFEAASFNRTFAKGEGLPGHVWSTGKPRWLLDVVREAGFPRAAAAARHDLHSAFACPVVVGDRTFGVIEFFTKRIREPDADLLEMMGTVAGNFGQFLERKLAEEQLHQSERELADFFDNATVGLHWVGPDGTILRANRSELDMLGYNREEYVGRLITDFHADQEVICDILQRLKNGEELHEYPARLKCKDGSIKHALIDSSMLVRDGEFIHTRCFTRDVTEQRRAERELAEAHQFLHSSLDALSSHIAVLDENGVILAVNDAWRRFADDNQFRSSTYGVGANYIEACEPKSPGDCSAPELTEGLKDLLSGRQQFFEFEYPCHSPTKQRWFIMRATRFKSPGPVRVVVAHNDVTKRKLSEDAVRHSEQKARFLADASAELAVLLDFDSTLQKISTLAVPTFADWATVDLVEADGSLRRVSVSHVDPAKVRLAHEVFRRFPPDSESPQAVWNILRTGKSAIVSEITDELLVQSINDDDLLSIMRELGLKSYIGVPLKVRGKTLGVISFINAESGHRYDHTDLAVAEDLASRAAIAIENAQLYRELRDADQRKDEFLATLAHELRNPLAPIRNGLQVLRLTGEGGEMASEARSMMERQVTQMVRLVDDLLDVSRITRNKLELKKQRVTLDAIVQNSVETSRPLIEEARHTLTITLPPTSMYLDADPTRLAQVFSNLLNNAAKYTEPGGRIQLIGEVYGSEVAVRIRDNGLGIPAEAFPKLFQMFSQVDGSLERAQGGLGIGLTLVKRLAEMHGGSVEARSDGSGQGSEFTVRLPILQLTQQTVAAQAEDNPTTKSKIRILVVDDNVDSALSLGMMLKLMGNEIHTVHDGLAAVEAAEQFRPDMILLDIGLPKLNGYDVCRRIREQPWSDGAKIVALTGWGQEEDRRRSREAGFDQHMVKPIELAALEKLLAAPAARSSSQEKVKRTTASLRVLVVDDMRAATHMLATLLKSVGHDVRTAADGPGALAAVIEYRPDVVLLDINMPGMTGLEVSKRIRQQTSLDDIVLVAMTGHGDEADRQRSFEAGFHHHLVKPADFRLIQEILATVNANPD